MKKVYVDFMKIKLSNDDRNIILDYLAEGLECSNVYSKIVVQFEEDDDDYNIFEEDDVYTDCFAICHEFDFYKKQYIMYSIDENAFDDICNILRYYNCSIYQFIIDEDSNYLDVNENYK